jgi:hypothetical protein
MAAALKNEHEEGEHSRPFHRVGPEGAFRAPNQGGQVGVPLYADWDVGGSPSSSFVDWGPFARVTPAFATGSQQCAPGYSYISCGGNGRCAPIGASCCGSNICPPGYECFSCGANSRCAPRGSRCCERHICPPGIVVWTSAVITDVSHRSDWRCVPVAERSKRST